MAQVRLTDFDKVVESTDNNHRSVFYCPPGRYFGFDFAPTADMNLTLNANTTGLSIVQTNAVTSQLQASPKYSIGQTNQGITFYEDGTIAVGEVATTSTMPRIDLIIASHTFLKKKQTEAAPVPVFYEIIQGTPAASPVAPSIPNALSSFEIGRLYLPANCTALNQSGVVYTQASQPYFAKSTELLDLIETKGDVFTTKSNQFNKLQQLSEGLVLDVTNSGGYTTVTLDNGGNVYEAGFGSGDPWRAILFDVDSAAYEPQIGTVFSVKATDQITLRETGGNIVLGPYGQGSPLRAVVLAGNYVTFRVIDTGSGIGYEVISISGNISGAVIDGLTYGTNFTEPTTPTISALLQETINGFNDLGAKIVNPASAIGAQPITTYLSNLWTGTNALNIPAYTPDPNNTIAEWLTLFATLGTQASISITNYQGTAIETRTLYQHIAQLFSETRNVGNFILPIDDLEDTVFDWNGAPYDVENTFRRLIDYHKTSEDYITSVVTYPGTIDVPSGSPRSIKALLQLCIDTLKTIIESGATSQVRYDFRARNISETTLLNSTPWNGISGGGAIGEYLNLTPENTNGYVDDTETWYMAKTVLADQANQSGDPPTFRNGDIWVDTTTMAPSRRGRYTIKLMDLSFRAQGNRSSSTYKWSLILQRGDQFYFLKRYDLAANDTTISLPQHTTSNLFLGPGDSLMVGINKELTGDWFGDANASNLFISTVQLQCLDYTTYDPATNSDTTGISAIPSAETQTFAFSGNAGLGAAQNLVLNELITNPADAHATMVSGQYVVPDNGEYTITLDNLIGTLEVDAGSTSITDLVVVIELVALGNDGRVIQLNEVNRTISGTFTAGSSTAISLTGLSYVGSLYTGYNALARIKEVQSATGEIGEIVISDTELSVVKSD